MTTRHIRPTAPDAEFASRYAKTYMYGFYMLRNGESVIDVIDDSERWVILNLNPQSVSISKPHATGITPTGGGGLVVERRGVPIAHGQISGTTGMLYTGDPGFATYAAKGKQLVSEEPDLDLRLGKISGFYKFYRLSHLFDLYAYYCKRGDTDVELHYMDFKGEEFWRVEPLKFDMRRQAKRPFSYDYDVAFTMLERSDSTRTSPALYVFAVQLLDKETIPSPASQDASRALDALTAPRGDQVRKDAGVLQTMQRMKVMHLTGLDYVRRLAGTTQRAFQNLLRQMNSALQVFDNTYSALQTIAETPILLLKQLNTSIDGLYSLMHKFAPWELAQDLNAWLLELHAQVDALTAYHITSYDENNNNFRLSQLNGSATTGRAKRGFASDRILELGDGTPDADPFLGTSGFALVTDLRSLVQASAVSPVIVIDGDTIFSIATRVFGDVQRFFDLVVLNDLQAPYIVSNSANKMPRTIAWGEYIMVPANAGTSQTDSSIADENVATVSGQVTLAGGAASLTDSTPRSQIWRTDQWSGYTLILRPGTATEEQRVVASNTTTVLTVNFDWDVPPALHDVYTLSLVLFSAQRPLTEDARAFGRDLLLLWNRKDGSTIYGSTTATLRLNARGDLATVLGTDNFIQAIMLRGATPIGRHPFHKKYGLAMPVGRAWSESAALLYGYQARQSFLRDPRIANVTQSRLKIAGNILYYSAEIQPINARKARLVQINATR